MGLKVGFVNSFIHQAVRMVPIYKWIQKAGICQGGTLNLSQAKPGAEAAQLEQVGRCRRVLNSVAVDAGRNRFLNPLVYKGGKLFSSETKPFEGHFEIHEHLSTEEYYNTLKKLQDKLDSLGFCPFSLPSKVDEVQQWVLPLKSLSEKKEERLAEIYISPFHVGNQQKVEFENLNAAELLKKMKKVKLKDCALSFKNIFFREPEDIDAVTILMYKFRDRRIMIQLKKIDGPLYKP